MNEFEFYKISALIKTIKMQLTKPDGALMAFTRRYLIRSEYNFYSCYDRYMHLYKETITPLSHMIKYDTIYNSDVPSLKFESREKTNRSTDVYRLIVAESKKITESRTEKM